MKVGIVPNIDKDREFSLTREIVSFLEEKRLSPALPEQVAIDMSISEYGVPYEELYEKSDFLVVLGGDGTLLSVGRKACIHNTPLLGINLGTLGFLTDVEKTDYKASIEKVLRKEYKTEKRLMLEASVLDTRTVPENMLALNDVCVTRGVFSKIVNVKVYVNGEYLNTFRSDGVIISTPTGSTAYNLSAGGPILKPDTKMIAITPICPHALYARSIVTSAEDIITIEADSTSRGDLIMSVDGQNGGYIRPGDKIQVKKSSYYTTIIKTNTYGFYDILRKKLVRNEG